MGLFKTVNKAFSGKSMGTDEVLDLESRIVSDLVYYEVDDDCDCGDCYDCDYDDLDDYDDYDDYDSGWDDDCDDYNYDD